MERELTWEEKLTLMIFGESSQVPTVSEAGKAYICGAKAMLPDCQREVLLARCQDGLTLEACAKKLGISKACAYRSEAMALRKLRHPRFIRELKNYITKANSEG